MAAATEYGIPHVAESLDALVTDPLVDQVLVLTTSQQHEEGTLVFSSHCIAQAALTQKWGYHGYRFLWKLVPQGRIHRQQGKPETSGNSLVSASCDRSTVN
jgi:hypothetical protein